MSQQINKIKVIVQLNKKKKKGNDGWKVTFSLWLFTEPDLQENWGEAIAQRLPGPIETSGSEVTTW